MISLTSLVFIVLWMLISAVVIGLLWWLIGYVESQGWGPPNVFKVVRVVFVVLIVVGLCLFLVSLTTGQQLLRT